MREHKLYANLKKCIFAASEIPVLGCFVGKDGVRRIQKIRAISGCCQSTSRSFVSSLALQQCCTSTHATTLRSHYLFLNC